MTPAELLAESTRLHTSVRPVKGVRPNGWRDVMGQAAALRQQAFDLDPAYDLKHDHFMRFYRDIGVTNG